MGQLMTKSEKRLIKEQTKKNTKVNRDMGMTDEGMLAEDYAPRQKGSAVGGASNADRQVSFNSEVKQLEYDVDNPGDAAGLSESIAMLADGDDEDFLDSEELVSEEGGSVSMEEYETSQNHMPPVEEIGGAGVAEPLPPPRAWKDTPGMVDSFVIHKAHNAVGHGKHPKPLRESAEGHALKQVSEEGAEGAETAQDAAPENAA